MGGYELSCLATARQFHQRGYAVTVLTSATLTRLETSAPASDLDVRPIFAPTFALHSDPNSRLKFQPGWVEQRKEALIGVSEGNVLALHRELASIQPDMILFFNPIGLGMTGVLEAATLAPARLAIVLMDDFDRHMIDDQGARFLLGRFKRLKQRFTAISCSRLTASRNSQFGQYRRYHVIPNGVDFDRPWLRQSGTGSNVRFVSFGRVVGNKGILELIRGAGALQRSYQNVRFEVDLIGSVTAEYRAVIEAEIRKNGVTNHIRLIGFMDNPELLKLLPAYDAAVLLFDGDEPFGNTAVEAAAAGLPVILTMNPGVAECFPSEYPLFVKDRANADGVAERLRFVIENRQILPELATALRDHLRAECDLKTKTIPAYENALLNTPVNQPAGDLNGLLAAHYTSTFYSLAC